MKTWKRIALAALLAGAAACSHPKATQTARPPSRVSDGDPRSEVTSPWTIGDMLGLVMQLDVDTLLADRTSGFAKERLGDGVPGRDWLEWQTNEPLAGFPTEACSIRWIRGMFDDPPADLWVYGCTARIARGAEGDEAFEWVLHNVHYGVPDTWSMDEAGPAEKIVRFHEPGSRLQRFDFGDVEVRRQPLTLDSDQLTVAITAVVEQVGS